MHFKTTNNQPTPPTPTTSTSLYPTTFGSLRAMHQCPLTNTQHSRWKGFRCGDQFTSCTNACGSGQSGDWKSSSDGNRLLCALVFFIQTYFFWGGVGKSNMLAFFFWWWAELNCLVPFFVFFCWGVGIKHVFRVLWCLFGLEDARFCNELFFFILEDMKPWNLPDSHRKWPNQNTPELGGGNSNVFMFTPNPDEMIHFDKYVSKELKPPTSEYFWKKASCPPTSKHQFSGDKLAVSFREGICSKAPPKPWSAKWVNNVFYFFLDGICF